MPDAPRKYYLINQGQLEAARKHWPQVSDKTWVLVLKRTDEPMRLSKPPHRGLGLATVAVPAPDKVVDGMYYRQDMDVLILIGGESPLAR